MLIGRSDGTCASAPTDLATADPTGLSVLLQERAHTLRIAPGQVAFPGGMVDPGEDPVAAALREAHEETGLATSGVQVLRPLPNRVMGVAGIDVTPVLAWWSEPSPVHAVDPRETALVFPVPVAQLVDPENRTMAQYQYSGHRGPAWIVQAAGTAHLIWGFTAGVLDWLIADLGWERPWNRQRVLDIAASGRLP